MYLLLLDPPSPPLGHRSVPGWAFRAMEKLYQLSILHMIVCMCQCYFLSSSHSLLPPLCLLFTITRTWKKPRYPLTDEWIKKWSYIQRINYFFKMQTGFSHRRYLMFPHMKINKHLSLWKILPSISLDGRLQILFGRF